MFKHEQNLNLPIGAMICAQGTSANMILADLKNPLHPIPRLTRDVSSLHLTAQPLANRFLPQIQRFQTTYINISHYIKNYQEAFTYEASGQARTTLYFENNTNQLVAYSSIKCSSLLVQEKPEYYSVLPTVELIMLCVDDRYHHKGIGDAVLSYIIQQVYNIRSLVGCRLITLFSVKKAVNFYKRFHFRELSHGMQIYLSPSYIDCVPMYAVLAQEQLPV